MLMANWQLMDVKRQRASDGLMAPWRDLARRSLAPAGTAAPEYLIPLANRQEGAEIVTARHGGQLLLALALRRRSTSACLASWPTPATASGLFHLDRTLGPTALEGVLRNLDAPVLLEAVPASGPFWDTLEGLAGRHTVLRRWQRAALRISGDYDTWFEGNFDRKRRKEYRRLMTRLSEQGNLEVAELAKGEDPGPWIAAFLELEQAGWKGKRGTALNGETGVAAALTQSCALLHQSGKLRFWSLRLDGRTIASLFAIIEGDEAWLGKICHDESLGRYSPGVLVLLEATRALFGEGTIKVVDSSAIPDHPMIDNIWRDRIAMADVMIAAATVSARRFALAVMLERIKRTAHGMAKRCFHALSRHHRS